MKIKMFFLLMLSCFYLNAYNWVDDWTIAVQLCQEQRYDEAESKLNDAIAKMENENETDFPEVYVDRARLYLKKNCYDLSLIDVEKAISNKKLSNEQLTRAIVTRISAKSNLGITEGILEDLNYIGKKHCPDIKHTDKYIILRNIPQCECFHEIMNNFFFILAYVKAEKT